MLMMVSLIRRSRRSFLLRFGQYAGLLALCLTLAVSCRGDGGSQPVADLGTGDRVSLGTTLKAGSLDPADAYETFPGILLYNLGDRLYAYTPGTTDLIPQLATELPTISDDGLTYTIPLRSDVKLHDGTPFDAEVMAFSMQRFIDNGGRPADLLSSKVKEVSAASPTELVITLKAPVASFTSLLTFSGLTPISPKEYKIGAGSFKPDVFIGSGPYKLREYSSSVIRLDANPDYWGKQPANSGIDIQIFTSAANLYNSFVSGSLDVAYQTLDPDQISKLEADAASKNWTVIEAGATVVDYLALNQKIAPFDNLDARKAVAAMMDRPLIVSRAFKDQADPLYSLIPPSFSEVYEPVFKAAYGDGNYDEAKKYLTAAGFSESKPMAFEIWYPSSSTPRSIAAQTIKQSIEQKLPGLVNVTINTAEAAALWGNVADGVYPSVLSNWYADYFDPENFVQPFLSCEDGSAGTLCKSGESQSSGSFYYSAKANELIAQQNAESDPAQRNEIFKQLQKMMAEDVPYIPLWQTKDYVFTTADVSNVEIQPNQQLLMWQIKKK